MADGPVWTIVLAAGSGQRLGAGPKAFVTLVGEERFVDRAVAAARSVSDGVVLVLPAGITWDGAPVEGSTVGGATRAESVRAGLALVPDDVEVIIEADVGHPLAPADLYERLIAAVRGGAAAANPVVPVVEMLQRVDDAGVVIAGIPKGDAVMVQAPQAFRAAALRRVHASGDAAMVESSTAIVGNAGRVVTVPGDAFNIHVTTPQELAMARALVSAGLV